MAAPVTGLSIYGKFPDDASLGLGALGIGMSAPADDGVIDVSEIVEPGLSGAGEGRIYFDSALGKFRVSEDGNAFQDLVAAAGLTIGASVIDGVQNGILFVGDSGGDPVLTQDKDHLEWDEDLFHLKVKNGALYVTATSNPSVAATGDGYEILFLKTHGTYLLTDFVLTNAIDRGSGAINSQTMRNQVHAAASFRWHTASIDGSAASQRALMIDVNQNVIVGSGTTAGHKLTVEGNVAMDPATSASSSLIRTTALDENRAHIIQYFDANWQAGFFHLSGDDYRFRVFVPGSGTTRAFEVYDSFNAATRFWVEMGTGHVGIGRGTTSPSARLDLDNQAAAVPIQIWRDNGTEVARIADGGDVGIGVTPSEKLSLKDHSAFTGSETNLTTGAAQTTDSTAQLKTITLSDTSAYWLEAEVVARREGTPDQRAFYKVAALVYREGGGATIEGAVADVVVPIETGGAAGYTATITVSGNDARVTVSSDSGHVVNWTCTLRYQRVSDDL